MTCLDFGMFDFVLLCNCAKNMTKKKSIAANPELGIEDKLEEMKMEIKQEIMGVNDRLVTLMNIQKEGNPSNSFSRIKQLKKKCAKGVECPAWSTHIICDNRPPHDFHIKKEGFGYVKGGRHAFKDCLLYGAKYGGGRHFFRGYFDGNLVDDLLPTGVYPGPNGDNFTTDIPLCLEWLPKLEKFFMIDKDWKTFLFDPVLKSMTYVS